MQISFDVDRFSPRGERELTNIMCYLRRYGCMAERHYPEIEKITCRTPSAALRYVRYFARNGISPESEAVFLKNPELGLRYLKMVRRSEFADQCIQKRFRRKFRTNAALAFRWAEAFGTRLEEDEEEVFRKDFYHAALYARQVIGGKFPEKIHGMILLASYGDVTDLQKRYLADYVKFAEKTGK
jgi:hypothetical protein